MAVLHNKEEKIQAILGRLPKKYTPEEFVASFIKFYPKDWGKIKAAYIKQSQDKEPGTVVNMPKPDLYLQQLLNIFLSKNVPATVIEVEEKPVVKENPSKVKTTKAAVKTPVKKASKNIPAITEIEEKPIVKKESISKAKTATAATKTPVKKASKNIPAIAETEEKPIVKKESISKAKTATATAKTPVKKASKKELAVATETEEKPVVQKAKATRKIIG
jgi:hypothetical protein